MSRATKELTEDDIFDHLSNRRRRYILQYLNQKGRSVPLSELVEEVAAWEDDKPVAELNKYERKRMYVSLYQTHLPRLAADGLIQYDPDERTVTPSDRLEELIPYIEQERSEPRWYLYYLGVALSGMSLLVSSFVGPQWARAFGRTLLPVTAGLLICVAVIHFLYSWLEKSQATELSELLSFEDGRIPPF